MATTVFNLSAVDRIEADVIATETLINSLSNQIAAQSTAIATLTKILTDLVTALGGSDQPAIDAATTALRDLTISLTAAVGRDKGV